MDQQQNLKIQKLENNYYSMAEKFDDLKKTVIKGFDDIKGDMKLIREDNERRFVSKESFEPVRMVVYGLVGVVLLGALTAILTIIYNSSL